MRMVCVCVYMCILEGNWMQEGIGSNDEPKMSVDFKISKHTGKSK